MAAYLPIQNLVFLHVPKVAGIYISALLPRLTKCQLISNSQHVSLDTLINYHSELWNRSHQRPLTVMAFFRHPASWYTSYFRFRTGTYGTAKSWESFGKGHILEPVDNCGAPDINQFVTNCIERYPGFLTKLYKQYYVSNDGKEIEFPGLYDRFNQDLRHILVDRLEIDPYVYDEAVKVQPILNKSKGPDATIDPAIARKLCDVEYEIVDRFWS